MSSRVTFAGRPITIAPGGHLNPIVTKDPAPTMLPAPITAPSSTMAPMPIKHPSSTVQPCKVAACPTVTQSPTTVPWSSERCTIALS